MAKIILPPRCKKKNRFFYVSNFVSLYSELLLLLTHHCTRPKFSARLIIKAFQKQDDWNELEECEGMVLFYVSVCVVNIS